MNDGTSLGIPSITLLSRLCMDQFSSVMINYVAIMKNTKDEKSDVYKLVEYSIRLS